MGPFQFGIRQLLRGCLVRRLLLGLFFQAFPVGRSRIGCPPLRQRALEVLHFQILDGHVPGGDGLS